MSSEPAKPVRVHRSVAGGEEPRDEFVVAEAPLQIAISGQPFSMTMRTPGADEALTLGLLFSEGVVRYEPGVCQLVVKGGNEVDVTIPEIYLCDAVREPRSIAATASCGICGKTTFVPVEGTALSALEPPLSVAEISAMVEAMQQQQAVFTQTGGSHAAALFSREGTLLTSFEDVGRHNAVDKCIGALLLGDALSAADILLVSGRVSYEIVVKAYRAGVPALCAVSAPSSLAVDTAQRLGVTLFGFCRGDRITQYTNLQLEEAGNEN